MVSKKVQLTFEDAVFTFEKSIETGLVTVAVDRLELDEDQSTPQMSIYYSTSATEVSMTHEEIGEIIKGLQEVYEQEDEEVVSNNKSPQTAGTECEEIKLLHYRLDLIEQKLESLMIADKYHRILHTLILALLLIILLW